MSIRKAEPEHYVSGEFVRNILSANELCLRNNADTIIVGR